MNKYIIILYHLIVYISAKNIEKCQEEHIKSVCSKVLKTDQALGPGLVRLAFHDCVGPDGCNGCFEDNADNAGLKKYADMLENVYRSGDDKPSALITRADFWILCSFVAIEEAHIKSGQDLDKPPKLTMKYGRRHCNSDTPYNPAPNDTYPSPHGHFNATMNYFANQFKLTSNETIALLGAHNLGRARKQNSGFENSWVKNEFAFENQFYKDMLNVTWVQKNVNNDTVPKWQWVHNATKNFMMFNSDMCLARDIRPDAIGRVNGTYEEAPQSHGYARVQFYAQNNALWLEDFASAYTKMIEKVSDNITLHEADKSTCSITTTKPATQPKVTEGGDNLSVTIHTSIIYLPVLAFFAALFVQ